MSLVRNAPAKVQQQHDQHLQVADDVIVTVDRLLELLGVILRVSAILFHERKRGRNRDVLESLQTTKQRKTNAGKVYQKSSKYEH